MSNMQIFESPEWGLVRTVELDGAPWLVGKDVAQALGYQNPQRAIRDHVEEEDKGVTETVTPGGTQSVTIINESGLYSLVLSSKLPSARRFRRWVTSVVLPSIRSTGGYSTGGDFSAIQKLWREQAEWTSLAEQFDQVARDSRRRYEESRTQRDQCRARARDAAAKLSRIMARIEAERVLSDG